ncbi:MAG: nickel-responsive transcriptional regulator NikR [Planctomycetaceae bacterium]|nr:nickel-responsive transcriptional regulator NikR [Planctomycetaceae bacterium]
MTSPITRISISVEEELLNQFDLYSAEQGYPTRSEAVKAVIRDALVLQQWEKGNDVAGAVSVVYDHHKPGTVQKILAVQHDWGDVILCSQHVHLDHDNCMEIVAVRGRGERIKDFLANLRTIKGLKHSVLTMSTTGE